MGENIKRPYRYRVGQRRTIDYFFKDTIDKSLSVLDVGCGIGTGMLHFKSLGFKRVHGIDNDPCRIEMARRRGLHVVLGDMGDLRGLPKFDIIWSSHSLEHSKNPILTLENLKNHTKDDAMFYFILPYPDFTPTDAHCGSRIIGLDKDDKADSVLDWFEWCGFDFIYLGFNNFREPEIWLEAYKK